MSYGMRSLMQESREEARSGVVTLVARGLVIFFVIFVVARGLLSRMACLVHTEVEGGRAACWHELEYEV